MKKLNTSEISKNNIIQEAKGKYITQNIYCHATSTNILSEVRLKKINALSTIDKLNKKFIYETQKYDSICEISDCFWVENNDKYILYNVDGKIHKLSINSSFSEELDYNNVSFFQVYNSILYLLCDKKLIQYDLIQKKEIRSMTIEDISIAIKFIVKDNIYIATRKDIYIYDANNFNLIKQINIDDITKDLLKEDIKYLSIIDWVLNNQNIIISFSNLDAHLEKDGLAVSIYKGSKKNHICSYDLKTGKIRGFKEKAYKYATFENTERSRIGEEGHHYLVINKNHLYSYFEDIIWIWNLSNKTLIDKIDIGIFAHGINSFTVYENYIICGGFTGELKIWDVLSKRCLYTFLEHSSWIVDVKLINDKLFSASGDNLIIQWDIEKIIKSEAYTPNICTNKWHNEKIFWKNKKILANFENGFLEMIDVDNETVEQLYKIGFEEKSINFYIDNDVLYFDIFAYNDTLHSLLVKLDLNTRCVKTVDHDSSTSKFICFDNKVVLCEMFGGEMQIYNDDLQLISQKKIHDEGIVDIGQNDTLFATVGLDNKILLWRKKDIKIIKTYNGWGAVYICNDFMVFSDIFNNLNFVSFKSNPKQYDVIKKCKMHTQSIREIFTYEDLLVSYDEKNLFLWSDELISVGQLHLKRNIANVRIIENILTIEYSSGCDDDLYTIHRLYEPTKEYI